MNASRISGSVSRFKYKFSGDTWFLAVALLIAGAAALPLFGDSGLLNTRGGGDSPFLLQRLHQLVVSLADDHFPVRWMPDANYGYGYPFYNYYAPFSIYVAAFFRFLGFGYVLSIKLAQLAGFIVAAWAMFQLARRWMDDAWAGLLAAAAYTLAPFHLANIYVRGDSLAEFWAMAFYPLIILAADYLLLALINRKNRAFESSDSTRLGKINVVSRRERLAVAWLAFTFAALVLSHNISALIFTPFILLILAIDWIVGFRRFHFSIGSLVRPLAALILALALSAWFWLPALAERSLAQMEPVTSGYFHYSNHFRLYDLVQTLPIFNYDVAGGLAFRIGLLQIVLALVGLLVLLLAVLRKDREQDPGVPKAGLRRIRLLLIIFGLVLSALMITPFSRFLWDNLPLLPFVQFPWRFLSIFAFFAALATAGLAFLPGRKIIVPLVIILLLATSLGGLKLDFLSLDDGDVTAERLAQYEWFTGNIGSTISAEYLPDSVQPRAFTSDWLNRGQRNRVQQLEGDLTSSDLLVRRATSTTMADGIKLCQSDSHYPNT